MRLNHSRLAVAPNQTNSLCLFSGNFPKAFFLLLATCWLLAVQGLQAQTTWDGSDNTDWFDADNWSAGIPDATDDVTIPDVTNDPEISTAAVAKSVAVAASATLTVTTNGELTINDWTDKALSNLGTVNNNGTIVVGSTSSGTGNFGIYNEATFNNNSDGLLTLDRGFVTNLRNLSGTFNNDGTITIGGIIGARFGIWNSATFNNLASGQITIDRVTSFGGRRACSTPALSTTPEALPLEAMAAAGRTAFKTLAPSTTTRAGKSR
jgi:hypothetical protein